jgi:hypothetical protein
MRNRRMLRMMAGEVRSPMERRLQREQRRQHKLAAEMEQRVVLVDKIRQREEGKPGFKAMPFAGFGTQQVAAGTGREDEDGGGTEGA